MVSGTCGSGKTQIKLARVFAGQLRTTGGSVVTGKTPRTISTTLFDGVMLVAGINKTYPDHEQVERMLASKRRRDTTMMRFCIKDSSIIIAIGNDADNDPFDPDFDKPATDAAQLEKIYEHFAFYFEIVDALD